MEDQSPLDSNNYESSTSWKVVNKGNRLGGFIIDYIVIVVLATALNIGLEVTNRVGGYIIGFTVYILYYILFEGAAFRTIGKLVLGLVVIDTRTGGNPGVGQIIIRTFSRLVPFEVFSLLVDELGWHDIWSNTAVVYKNSLSR